MRRPVRPRPLAAGLLLALAQVAHAQPGAGLPVPYLHADKENGSYDTREQSVGLRPNAELPFYAYLRNTSADDLRSPVTVILARDKDGKQPLATGTVPGLPGGKAVRVPLAVAVAGPPAPPPAAPAKPGDPAPPPAPPPALGVPDTLYLLATFEGEDKKLLVAPAEDKRAVPVQVVSPTSYIETVGQPAKRRTADGLELTVTLRDRLESGRPFRGPPARVRLDVRPALLTGLDPDAPKAGTYETVLPPGAKEVVLAALKLRFPGREPQGRFAVGVDGYERAFVFDVGPEGNDATPLRAGFAWLDLPRYAVPGKPLAVRAEVFLEPPGSQLRLDFQRAAGGEPQGLLPGSAGPRDVARTVRAGEAGELLFGSTVRDWVVPVDTAGVYGDRQFALSAVGPDGTPAGEPARRTVTFDATPPEVTRFDVPLARYTSTRLRVAADVADAESPVTEVLFILGDPPLADGKLPPGTEVVTVVPKPGVRPTAEFILPDTKGKVKVGVRATNAAGLATLVEPKTVLVVDPPKPKEPRTVGDIKVKVVQGSSPERPQAGLPVELRTAAGAVVDVLTTDDKGEATFADLKPGGYVVTSVKLSDGVARAVRAASVKADKQTEVTLELRR